MKEYCIYKVFKDLCFSHYAVIPCLVAECCKELERDIDYLLSMNLYFSNFEVGLHECHKLNEELY